MIHCICIFLKVMKFVEVIEIFISWNMLELWQFEKFRNCKTVTILICYNYHNCHCHNCVEWGKRTTETKNRQTINLFCLILYPNLFVKCERFVFEMRVIVGCTLYNMIMWPGVTLNHYIHQRSESIYPGGSKMIWHS